MSISALAWPTEPRERGRLCVLVARAIEDSLSDAHWDELGFLTQTRDWILNHDRLLRSLHFGDDDYKRCILDFLEHLCDIHPDSLAEVLLFEPIKEWFETHHPDQLERYNPLSPGETCANEVLERFGEEAIIVLWNKALTRRAVDPEGAITAVRSLLESTCKHILERSSISYESVHELGKLYRMTAERLRLSADQHDQEVFKQILSGCANTVIGLGSMRNRFSDAHGQGPRAVRPARRHAELAVNIGGAIVAFLIQTFEARIQEEAAA